MIEILRALYQGDFDVMELRIKSDSRYMKKATLISDRIALLCGENDEMRESTSNLLSSYEDEIAFSHFALGARWGARIMLALLEENDETFVKKESYND